jgi:hypothetical protein
MSATMTDEEQTDNTTFTTAMNPIKQTINVSGEF